LISSQKEQQKLEDFSLISEKKKTYNLALVVVLNEKFRVAQHCATQKIQT
jgi:hypothetical protein